MQNESKSYAYVIDNLNHITIIALLFYVLWIPIAHYKYLLSWHAILGTIAFLLLMSESITLLNNPWFTKYITTTKEIKIWTHGLLFTVATICSVLSVILEYYRKDNKQKKKHFHTIHGITALLATIITVIAFFTGFSVSLCEKLQDRIRPVLLKAIHNVVGQLAYGLGMFSLICAYYSDWIISTTTIFERIVLVLLTMFVTIWILFNAGKSLYRQIKSMQS